MHKRPWDDRIGDGGEMEEVFIKVNLNCNHAIPKIQHMLRNRVPLEQTVKLTPVISNKDDIHLGF